MLLGFTTQILAKLGYLLDCVFSNVEAYGLWFHSPSNDENTNFSNFCILFYRLLRRKIILHFSQNVGMKNRESYTNYLVKM